MSPLELMNRLSRSDWCFLSNSVCLLPHSRFFWLDIYSSRIYVDSLRVYQKKKNISYINSHIDVKAKKTKIYKEIEAVVPKGGEYIMK